MANGATAVYALIKPEVGADSGAWGTHLNTDLDTLDTTIKAVSDVADAALPKAGGTMPGTITGTSVTLSATLQAATITATGALSANGTGGVGYSTGAGGAVSQGTSKSTGVTINKTCGTITMFATSMAAITNVTFTVTNSTVAATDLIYVMHDSVGSFGSYLIVPNSPGTGSFNITVRNVSINTLAEAIVLRFAVIKGVVA